MAWTLKVRKGCSVFAGLLAAVALAGCKRDTGECNLTGSTPDGRPVEGPAAFDIAYRSDNGLPMYEGQAIIQSSCGDGQFCHSSGAEGENRRGVPKGYDFDVFLADVACDPDGDPGCENEEINVCGEGDTSDFCTELERLDDSRARCANEAGLMIAEIRRGYMPPGAAGEAVQNRTTWLQGPRASDPTSSGPGTPLPSLDSSDGQEIVRNWLACRAPVVGRTEPAPTPDLELKPCDQSEDEANGVNCVFAGPLGQIPDPTWSSIYASLIFTQCLSCHAPLNGNQDLNPDNPIGGTIPGGADDAALAVLDMSGSDSNDTSNWAFESHAAVVDALASAEGECFGQGTLVIPNDPAGSILLQKIKAEQTCGDEMPPVDGERTIITPTIDAVEEWINSGAPNN
jgi:hypothetical protein